MADLLSAFDALKRKRGVVDFDDLLMQCADELRRDRDFAAATRWRFRHLVVDEFQDINPAQFALLELIRGDRADLCVVGDPRQAIYGWNGADPTLLDHVEQTYPGVRVVRLRSNYRCTPAVVTAAAEVLSTAGRTDDSRAVRADGPAVELLGAADEIAEAAAIARRVRDLRPPGGRWRSIAVLARTNHQLGPIATALDNVGIPAILGPRGRETDEAERRLLLAEARGLSDPDALRTWATDLAAGLGGDAPSALHRELAGSLRRFLAASPTGTGRSFAEWHAVDASSHAPADGVELLTFHAAKGREWRAVIVAGIEVGLVPHAGAGSAGADEEVRLLYVAITRARDAAVLTWAEQRNGRTTGRSPLLRSITVDAAEPPGLPSFARRPRRHGAPRWCRHQRPGPRRAPRLALPGRLRRAPTRGVGLLRQRAERHRRRPSHVGRRAGRRAGYDGAGGAAARAAADRGGVVSHRCRGRRSVTTTAG